MINKSSFVSVVVFKNTIMRHECVFVQSGSVNPAVGWWRGRLRPSGAGNAAPPAGVCQ